MSRICLIALLGLAFCQEVTDLELTSSFKEFMMTFDKDYPTVEETIKRYNIFAENYKYIQEHNSKGYHFKLGINQFSDITIEEFREIYPKSTVEKYECPKKAPEGDPIPINWTERGCLTEIKNQESCRSDWAFTVIGSIEAMYKIIKKDLYEFSAQQIIDCVDTSSCSGGSVTDAFGYIANKGAVLKKDNPYKARKDKCQSKNSYSLPGQCKTIETNTVNEFMKALYGGPVAVKVRADNKQFLHYKSGVLDWGCGTDKQIPDYNVLLVGSVKKDGIDSWIIRNSWGKYWGEQGYAYIERKIDEAKAQKNGRCGIITKGIYVTRK